MSLLIAVDPGITSGVVVFKEEDSVLDSAHALDASDTLQLLRDAFTTPTADVRHVVYEQFRLYGNRIGASKSFSDLPEVRIIGAITALCGTFGVSVASLPAGVYKSATANWLPPPEIKGPHQRDAWRLGMWFQVVRQGRPATIRLKDGRIYKMFYDEHGHKEITIE